MKIRLIAIALTMLMIISGFAVLVSYAPANNSIPVSPYVVGSNDTLLYEYQINNTGSAFTNGYFPFTFTDENLFIFNTTNSVVQNVKFLYSNGTQIKGFIPTGQTGLPNTDQGSGNWLVYFTNFSMTSGQSENIYMQVFPYTESVLNANFSTSNEAYIGYSTAIEDFSNTSLWWIHSSAGTVTRTASSLEVSGSENAVLNASYNGTIVNGVQIGYTQTFYVAGSGSGSQVYDYNIAGDWNTGYGSGFSWTSSGSDISTTVKNTTGYHYASGVTLIVGTAENVNNHLLYKSGLLNFTANGIIGSPALSTQSVSLSSFTFGVLLGSYYSGGYGEIQNVYAWNLNNLMAIGQKNIGTVTSISQQVTNTGNYILFNETGLPYGQSWNVSLTNKTANVVNSVYASTTNTAKAFLPSGYNYSFSFSTFDASYYKIVNLTGSIYLSPKANATVNITLTNVSYDVVFHESGLLSGNTWGINFNGTDHNTTSASLTLIEKNGSYPFTVLISNLYNSNVSSGYANVSGKSVNLYIGFTYHAFNITFSEVGLPSDVQWSMTINGTVYHSNVSNSNILLFQGKAGSYDGIVNNASYYTPVDKYFNFTITGNAHYTIDYGIVLTFIETGYNGIWHITIDGKTYSSSTNTIVATVSPGQVVFNVWGVSGYTINPEVVTQTYTSAQTIKIAFTVQPASFENVLISTPMVILYFVLAIMAMAGVVYWRLKHER